MKSFRTIFARDLDSVSLKNEMETYGYVFIRDLMPKGDLEQLLSDMIGIASDEGWLIEGTAPSDRLANPAMACFDPDPIYKQAANRAFCLERLHALTHHPALTDVMKRLVGPHLLVHPKPIATDHFPQPTRAPFCMRIRTTRELQEAPIAIQRGCRCMIASRDRGRSRSRKCRTFLGFNTPRDTSSRKTAQGGDWVGGRINAGDVVIFHSLTVHTSTLSTSNQLRCSVDCRFQSYDEAVSPFEIVFPNRAKGGRTWETTYADWKHDDLKYYWRDLPLRLKPSVAELAAQAEKADSPEKRLRYTTTLELIEQEIPMLVH